MPKKYAVCVAHRDVADPHKMIQVVAEQGWSLTGRMNYLEPVESGANELILGDKIPKKLWGHLPRLMLDGRSILFPVRKEVFEISLSYICDGDLRAIAVNWKGLAAPENLYSELFLPLASGLGANVAALVHSEGDWASNGFQNNRGVLEIRRSLIDWARHEHHLYVRESARDMVRGVNLGDSAEGGWLHATLET